MLYSAIFISAVLASATVARTTHHVKVGAKGLTFEPDTVKAGVGDIVRFDFYPANHSVAQSTFDAPCQPISTTKAIYSGFIPSSDGAASTAFAVTINSTASIWLYCSQTEHCQQGMVMVINPPPNGINLAAYKAAAEKTTGSSSPQAVGGGVIVNNSGSSNSSSSTSTSSSSSSTSGSITSSPASSSGTGSASTAASSSGSSTAGSATGSPTTSTSSAAAAGPAAPTGFLEAVLGLILSALL